MSKYQIFGIDQLSYFLGKIKSIFADINHTHTKSEITDFPTIPTKTSQLTNDSGYKTTDNNTTYSISKSGNNVTLTGSDGSTSSFIDSNTTYNVATSTEDGLMSKEDKEKLDSIIGGYYTPSVSSDGVLSWTASKTGMNPVSSTDLGSLIQSYVEDTILGGTY